MNDWEVKINLLSNRDHVTGWSVELSHSADFSCDSPNHEVWSQEGWNQYHRDVIENNIMLVVNVRAPIWNVRRSVSGSLNSFRNFFEDPQCYRSYEMLLSTEGYCAEQLQSLRHELAEPRTEICHAHVRYCSIGRHGLWCDCILVAMHQIWTRRTEITSSNPPTATRVNTYSKH